jgi:hypothetical protein
MPSSLGLTPVAFETKITPFATTAPDTQMDSQATISNLNLFPGQFFSAVLFNWLPTNPINADGYSPVLFLTSDGAPRYLLGETESPGGSGSMGDIPSVPEPTSSLLIWGVGLAMLLRQRRV